MDDYQTLKTEQADSVLTVTLDRPKANAFDNVMVKEWLGVLKQAARDDEIRCLVLTGAGRFFSAGQDVTALGADDQGELSFMRHLESSYNRIILQMRELEKPIVGAINGPAVGAGLGIALATDLRIAGESASFIYGFTGLALTADSATSLHLPLLMGFARATEFAFTNKPLSAEDALKYGLVNQVVDDELLMQEAAALANSLAQGPTKGLGLTKRAMNRAMTGALRSTLQYEAYLQEIAGKTEDHQEGVAAFLEKRAPNFAGR